MDVGDSATTNLLSIVKTVDNKIALTETKCFLT